MNGDNPLIFELTVISVSVLASAFFSGMEIAFISANRLHIELKNKQGEISGKILSRFTAQPGRFLCAMLVGNNAALVVYGIFTGALIINLIPFLKHSDSELLRVSVQTVLSTSVLLVTAEFLPKAFFRLNPNKWLSRFSLLLAAIYAILYIPVRLVMFISKLTLLAFPKSRLQPENEGFGTVDLDHFINEASVGKSTDEEVDHEIRIFKNALGLSKKKVRDCMVPRNEIVAVDIETPMAEVRRLFEETHLSKILVYRGDIDNIIGYAHGFDLFKKPESVKNIIRPITILPEAMPVSEALETGIREKRNLMIVLDEFGGTSGILTIEDMVEEIFGEIDDEHDNESLTENELEANTYLFSARLEIDYLNDKYAFLLPENEEYETLGGLIINRTGSIPEEGEEIEFEEFKIKVIKAGKNKVEEVLLTIRK
jgi:putative hemolysin